MLFAATCHHAPPLLDKSDQDTSPFCEGSLPGAQRRGSGLQTALPLDRHADHAAPLGLGAVLVLDVGVAVPCRLERAVFVDAAAHGAFWAFRASAKAPAACSARCRRAVLLRRLRRDPEVRLQLSVAGGEEF